MFVVAQVSIGEFHNAHHSVCFVSSEFAISVSYVFWQVSIGDIYMEDMYRLNKESWRIECQLNIPEHCDKLTNKRDMECCRCVAPLEELAQLCSCMSFCVVHNSKMQPNTAQ